MVWLPATAVVPAEVSARTSVFELDPCLPARTPSKSVNDCAAVLRDDRSVPIEVSAVSSFPSEVNWLFHGVSTACRLATIALTVVATSNPCPLVGEPKLSPTDPMPRLPPMHYQGTYRQ